jgi:hypothetical protein
MPNAIKYNTSAETLALKKGNFYIGTGDVGKGPTSSTGYYNGITPPSGGYTIYLNKESNGPSIYTVTTEAQMVSLTNTIGAQSFTTSGQCLNWFATQTDKMIFNRDYEPIVTNGLMLNVDAGFTPSYPTTATTWYDLSSNGYNGILTNGCGYSPNDGGSITYDGADDWAYVPSQSIFNTLTNNFTVMGWIKPSNMPGLAQRLFGLGYVSQWQLELRGGNTQRLSINYNQSGVNYFNTSGPLVTWEVWNHIGFVINNGVVNYILNGQLYNGFTISGNFVPSGQPFSIGNYNGQGDGAYKGNISSCQLYNRALSATEINQNYNAITQRFNLYANPLTVFKSNLTLWLDTSLPTATSNTANYNTIDTTGTVSFSRIYDMSGNGSHASQINKNRQPTLGTTSNSKNISISDGTKGFALSNISDGLRTIYIVHKNSSLSVGRGGASNGFVIQGTSFYGYSSQFNFAPYDNQVRCNLPSPAANNRLQITILVSFSDRTEGYTTTNNGVITSPTTVMKNNYYLGNNTLNYLTNSGSYYQVGMFCRNLGGDSNIDSFEAGEFAEIIVVNRISTADEIATTQNYLYNKWFN